MANGVSDGGDQGQKRKRLPYEERRREFVQKAVEFFAEEGFESSTRELARRLDVTQPLLYRYFPSKDDLIAEVYDAVYVRRWRSEWDDLLSDRATPIRDRLRRFYQAYTQVVFQRDWVRIYLFSGLKGGALNRRYIERVRERIFEPVMTEWRLETGHPARPASDAEIELAWIVHGGLYYYGVRNEIYGQESPMGLDFVIDQSIEFMFSGLERLNAD